MTSFIRPWAHRAFSLLLCGALLGGCAFRNYMDRGHEHAARGDYRAALAEYDRALKHDSDSEEAKKRRDQVRPYAIEQAIEELEAQLKSGRYEDAHEQATYVGRLDKSKGASLKKEIAKRMMAELDVRIAEGRMETAYVFSARFKKLYPNEPGIASRLKTIRRALYSQSDSALARSEYEDALEPLSPVARFEPSQAAEVKRRRTRIRNTWADSLVLKAKKSEASQHKGVAAALYAHAYEIARRPEDLAALRRLTPELARQAAFVLAVKPNENSERAREVGNMLEHRASSLSGVRLPTTGDGATMVASLGAAPFDCSQSATQSMGERDYVASTRWVDNPKYVKLDHEIRAQERKADRLTTEIASERHTINVRLAASDRCVRLSVDPARQARDAAIHEHESAEAEVRSLQERVAKIERRIARSRRPQRKGKFIYSREALRKKLEEAQRKLKKAKKTAYAAKKKRHREQAQYNHATYRCNRIKAEGDSAALRLRLKKVSLLYTRNTIRRLSRKRAATPDQIKEDVIKVFNYPVSHITRRCDSRGTMELKTAWDPTPQLHKSSAKATTQDDTHAAYPRYGVIADALDFPVSDSMLMQRTDKVLVAELLSTVRGRIKDYYRYMSDRAFEWKRDDPDAASDIMVALVLAGRSHIDKNTLARFAAHLSDRHGLKKLRTLSL